MNDDLYLIVVGVAVLITALVTLFGMHHVSEQGRLMRERISRIGTCPACHHASERLTCGCDLMTDPEVLSA